MDRFIAALPAVEDGDLMLSHEYGVAWQKDQTNLVPYDQAYFDKCGAYADDPVAQSVNAARVAFVAKHYGVGPVVDVGIGDGAFLRLRANTWGFDVNPYAESWLKRQDKWAHFLSDFDAFTFWDVLEHVPTPEDYFKRIAVGCYLFASVPVFWELSTIRESKHYRPNEHLYYWVPSGFVGWMERHGFRLLEKEVEHGRDWVMRFAFERVRDAG